MNRSYKFLALSITAAVLITGCKKIDEIQKNPNASDQASPKLIVTGIQYDMYDNSWSDNSYSQRMAQTQVLNFDYYGNQSYTWGSGSFYYNTLRNVGRLETEADKQGVNTVTRGYKAFAKFAKAMLYSKMTEQMGDIPLSEAMQGADGVHYPKYDSQKSVYLQCLQWLTEANTELAAILTENPNAAIEGDIYYGGSLAKWQQAVNSLSLRLLISLSKKEADGDLNLKERFNAIVSNPAAYPVILTNSSNLQMTYNSTDKSNNFPVFPDDSKFYVNRNILGATWVDLLTGLKDPRIFIIASPAENIPEDPADPFARYKGANSGAIQSEIQTATNAGLYAYLNRSYWLKDASGIPCIQLGASETAFNIAEGINRGWTTGDAGEYYKMGITQSMLFYGVEASDIADFLAQPEVTYAGNDADGLEQILTQKYVAYFGNSGWQAYYNQRRTGVPAFVIGPANENGGMIPVRFSYPSAEYTNNKESVTDAVQEQFGGSDTRNDVMWLIK
ncbi:SusD/RagB family nutrient-binding outer membrane lipoprotein [Flavihumibacter petaseus]|uniref:SusD/RagB family protein n=1 Tax=Flavihumibacter petaseus NBRC 106054 TaxID=1220578 RepID=A0A0E9N4A7_9BACT|nr:SusD/RagB family nutrient-binding outer membrane lipoprotein [Flavihumibacter petaseus]GAO44623.1 hypothetical protein FPE01S_03_06620 [Flavihumibacter petaseus NBRC 106054]